MDNIKSPLEILKDEFQALGHEKSDLQLQVTLNPDVDIIIKAMESYHAQFTLPNEGGEQFEEYLKTKHAAVFNALCSQRLKTQVCEVVNNFLAGRSSNVKPLSFEEFAKQYFPNYDLNDRMDYSVVHNIYNKGYLIGIRNKQ